MISDGPVQLAGALLREGKIMSIACKYATHKQKALIDVGLNLFVLISDTYHRENFHSDILKIILDPKSPHQEGDKYLMLFLEYLSETLKVPTINLLNYRNAEVVREEGRIDLLIRDAVSKRAIFIENKMNDAGDMRKQIPRYLDYLKTTHSECDAVIYLRLNTLRYPDQMGWSDEEQREVASKLVCAVGYDASNTDLLTGWIAHCERASSHVDALFLLRQYGALLKKLGETTMNKDVMNQFLSMMLDEQTNSTAVSLISMLEELRKYRTELIIEKFKNDVAPFTKVSDFYLVDAAFKGFIYGDANFGLDVIANVDSYGVGFWDTKDRVGEQGRAKAILEKMNCLHEYRCTEGGVYGRSFAFPSQHFVLIDYIATFKASLKNAAIR